MKHVAVQTYIGDLTRGHRVKLVHSSLNERLHQVVVHIGHDLLAKEEADSDKVPIEVRLRHIRLNVLDGLFEDWQLCDPDASVVVPAALGIQDNH